MRTKFLILTFLFFLSPLVKSQEIRKYANNYLYNGVDARGRAMGNAISAYTDDVFSSYWNPAGLANIDRSRTQIGYMHVFDGLYNYDVFGMAFPSRKKKETLSFTVLRYGVDNIPNTIFLVDNSGNINPELITTFNAADYGGFLSYGKVMGDNFKIGGSAKILYRNVGDFAQAWGGGLDIGLQYTSDNSKFNSAIFAKDVLGTYTSWDFKFTDPEIIAVFENTGNKLPESGTIEATSATIVFGVNYDFDLGEVSIKPEIDMDMTIDGQRNTLISTSGFSLDPYAGLEIGYENSVFLRAGVNNIQEVTNSDTFETKWDFQPSIGAGVHLPGFGVDYALTQFDFREEYTHLISLKIGLLKSKTFRDEQKNKR